MHITGSALSLTVDDVEASADFARRHFGFTDAMSADGFVAITHPDLGWNITLLRTGLPSFRPERIAGPSGQGLLVVFVVDDVDAEFARVAAAGAEVVTPPETEPWGERYCQVADPNGIVWQLVTWV
ncbi:VOC family protein [Cellulomonas sp. KH9]|uniref:VOC family protein n=1 Tax=Cellulomonas sp. KH9 TaxID=1855324 RepID=UPI0008EABD74|nr:VOC family protein [Cellulomonas sp. KH9]SFK04561.1 Uncharacterized conserved protein PhnB, glyoxalase superfamily [Cellulomonas sp. KH9]